MFDGSCRATAEIADCTSSAAPSRSRERLNWSVIEVEPWADEELMLSRPAIVVNCFSSGVATDDAIVSGEAPGRDAETWIVGKSTFGRSETGRSRYAITPKTRRLAITSVVMTGRRMKISERFMTSSPRRPRPRPPRSSLPAKAGAGRP